MRSRIKIADYIIRLLIMVSVSSAAGLLLLLLAWTVPADALKSNVDYGVKILKNEGYYMDYDYLFTFAWGARVDTGADAIQLNSAAKYNDDMSLIQNAMYSNGDVRYWNGYMIFYRPLLAVMTYAQFRYGCMLLIGILLWFIFMKTNERLGKGFSFAFLLAMLLTNIIIVPWSNIHGYATAIYLGSVLYILYKYKKDTGYMQIFTMFGVFALLNMYFDRITVLAQSLGMPLLFFLFIDHVEYGERSFVSSLKKTVCASLGWGLNLLFFWMAKWAVASLVLNENVFANATGRMNEYVQTDGAYLQGRGAGRIYCIAKNLASLIPSHGEGIIPVAVIVLITAAVMLIRLIKKRPDIRMLKIFVPEFLVMFGLPLCLYIFTTYMSLFNATCFAYRYQSLWLFGVLALYFMLIGMNKKGE